MAWIPTVDEDAASGELAELYDNWRDPATGEVDNILKVHSLDPPGLRAHLAVYQNAMSGTDTLPKAEREMIAVVVSSINACRY